jgi:hypothetical protein
VHAKKLNYNAAYAVNKPYPPRPAMLKCSLKPRHYTSSYLIPVWVPGEGANVELALRGDKMANAASLNIPHTQVTLNNNNASFSE